MKINTILFILMMIFVPCLYGEDFKPVQFNLTQPGKVSCGIYSSDGKLLRTLMYGKSLEAGDHILNWDGLDSNGLPAPIGTYNWRLLRNEGLQAKYLINVAANPGWAPYDMWVGSHGTVGAVALDENKRLYVGATSSENCSAFICTSLDGKTLFWNRLQLDSFKGSQRMEVRDGKLYILHQDAWLYILNSSTKITLSKHDLKHPLDERNDDKHAFLPKDRIPNGLAIHTTYVAISHPFHNVIRYHDPVTFAFVKEVEIPNLQSITSMADGTLIAAAGNKIVKVANDSTITTVVDDINMNAVYVAIDENRDELWVAESLKAHSLRKYKLSSGVLSLQLGHTEGRPFGKFDPLSWRDFKDIKCDGQGGIITVEATPRRVAHFKFEEDCTTKPVLINQWFGGQQWGNFTATDPLDPTISYCNASSFHRARVKINYATRTWEMESLYDAPSWVSRQEGNDDNDSPFPSLTQHESQWQVMHQGSETYLVTPGGHSGNRAPAIIKVDVANHKLIPFACAGLIRSVGGVWPAWFFAIKPDAPTEGKLAITTVYAYAWSDLNKDGQLQNTEFKIAKAPGLSNPAHGHIDNKWNVTLPVNPLKGVTNQSIGIILKNLATDLNDPPIWDWEQAVRTVEKIPDDLVATGRSMIAGIHRDQEGRLSALFQGHGNPIDDRHGDTWPGNLIGVAKILHYNANGQLIGAFGKHGTVNSIGPGEFQLPKRILGTANDCILVQDRRGRPGQAWTSDGLYAGSFLDRYENDGLPFDKVYKYPTSSQGVEMFLPDQIGGCIVNTVDGKVLWNPAGRNSAPIYQINGWDNWERQTGSIEITEVANKAMQNGIGLKGCYFNNKTFTAPVLISRTDKQLRFGNRILVTSDCRSGLDWLLDTTEFSAKWTGKVEPVYSEDYKFVIEYDEGAVVKMYLDGQLLMESPPKSRFLTSARMISQPIPMKAGIHRDIKVEYISGSETPHIHLSWESLTRERQQIPTKSLFTP